MLSIGNKKFMNLQEAVGWLLENNALPFQSTANYAGNTEIAMSTLINPSPAKVRVGSLIFFADSKVSTVIGITSNSFICSDQYNDLVDDIVYVSNVALNASGHLIITLSNGDNIDAGLIKQVTGFSIDGSQHLIVSYNDSTSTDLGAIFSGNISISGNLTVSGGISGNAVTGNSIIENMAGYYFTKRDSTASLTYEYIYAGIVKNGNKLTLALAMNITRTDSASTVNVGHFTVPRAVADRLVPTLISGGNYLDNKKITVWSGESSTGDLISYIYKSEITINFYITGTSLNTLALNKKYYYRYEATFLLGDNLAS